MSVTMTPKISDIMVKLSQVVLDFVNVTLVDGRGKDGDGQGSEDEEN